MYGFIVICIDINCNFSLVFILSILADEFWANADPVL